MVKIIGVEKINDCSVLFLDNSPPSTGWNTIVIGGKEYAPVPVYDMKETVAVKGFGFVEGQTVSFA